MDFLIFVGIFLFPFVFFFFFNVEGVSHTLPMPESRMGMDVVWGKSLQCCNLSFLKMQLGVSELLTCTESGIGAHLGVIAGEGDADKAQEG